MRDWLKIVMDKANAEKKKEILNKLLR